MLVLYIMLGIIAVLCITYYFIRPIRICGDSMYPTMKDGEYYIAVRVLNKDADNFRIGEIYVYKSPYDRKYVIKRLHLVSPPALLYFIGDNTTVSYDSRHYGFVPKNDLKFRVLTKRKEQKASEAD